MGVVDKRKLRENQLDMRGRQEERQAQTPRGIAWGLRGAGQREAVAV